MSPITDNEYRQKNKPLSPSQLFEINMRPVLHVEKLKVLDSF